jgi:ribosomal protein S18 acetylase RimI-like enzyme
LDRPVWGALTGGQAQLALGDARAWALDPRYGYFAAARDGSGECQAALAALVPAGGVAWLCEPQAQPAPPGCAVDQTSEIDQMVADGFAPRPADDRVEGMQEADAAEMAALAHLTEPGPWLELTHRLSPFLGVRIGGRLAAMAGERMRPAGYGEVSGVCTHPDFRGRGLAGALISAVASRIAARGDTPMLHVYPENTGAIRLYEALGFVKRRTMVLTVVTRA